MDLKPLNLTFAYNTSSNQARWAEPVWYDFLIGEGEKCILIIIADEHLAVWELDSTNNWYHMSVEDEEKNPRAGAKAEWRRVAYVPAPFSTRFHADLNDGRLTLITETGDVWFSANGQYGFQKKEASGTEKAVNASDAILIEDTDNHEVWRAPISTSSAEKSINPHLLSGAGKSSDRVEKALRAIRVVAARPASLPK